MPEIVYSSPEAQAKAVILATELLDLFEKPGENDIIYNSIVEHPLWDAGHCLCGIAKWLLLEISDKHRHHQYEAPPLVVDYLRSIWTHCVSCGRDMRAFRSRTDGSVYLAVSCAEVVNALEGIRLGRGIACDNGTSTTNELLHIQYELARVGREASPVDRETRLRRQRRVRWLRMQRRYGRMSEEAP